MYEDCHLVYALPSSLVICKLYIQLIISCFRSEDKESRELRTSSPDIAKNVNTSLWSVKLKFRNRQIAKLTIIYPYLVLSKFE